MPYSVLLHISGEDSIIGEVDELPDPHSQFLLLSNPRLRDGRDVTYLLQEVRKVIYPWNRIYCLEILPSEEDEKVVTFIRE